MSSDWKIDFDKKAKKEFDALDKTARIKIAKYLKKILKFKDPRKLGASLDGNLNEYWKYSPGKYRIICKIIDKLLTILVIRIDHRKDVYK